MYVEAAKEIFKDLFKKQKEMLLAIASKLLHQILDKLVDDSTANSTTEAVSRRCSVKKDVLRNFAEFTGKHLFQGLFFNKVVGLSPQLY